jgi:hypothetical protein
MVAKLKEFVHNLRSAHAALSPWEGQNALDAAVLAYNSIAVLRQQVKPTHRIHGIFMGKDWAPNGTYHRSMPSSIIRRNQLYLQLFPTMLKCSMDRLYFSEVPTDTPPGGS